MIYSWTSTSDFMNCPRKYHYKHVLGWNRHVKPSVALLRGQAVHQGLAAALRSSPTECNSVALEAAHKFLVEDKIKAVTQPSEFDVEGIYLEAWQEASAILSTYVPLLGLGTDWEVARLPSGEPLVEFPLTFEVDGRKIAGTFDAILINLHTGRLTMVDWKTREAFPPAYAMICDGQLPFYAAFWNHYCRQVGRDMLVDEVAMVDMRVKIPSPASISVKNGLPNTGAAFYDTTWENWVRTLPANIDPEKYRELMMPKLKTMDYYLRWNFFPVTMIGEVSAWQNFNLRIDLIEKEIFPPVYNAFTCQMCAFNSICGSFGRYNHAEGVPAEHQFTAAGFTHEIDTRYGEFANE